MLDLWADLETRSRIDLKASGARRYASDTSTQITSAVWYFQGTMRTACPVHPHLGTFPIAQLYVDLMACSRFVAHHANFDANILMGQNPFLKIPVFKISCTMARAQSLSLPGGLEELCMTLNVQGKDPRGRQLVQLTCKPQRDGTFCEDIQTFRDLINYNGRDTNCLMTVDKLLPELSLEERKIFERSWRKNDIGLPIDLDLAVAIAARRTEIEHETSEQLMELTNGAVEKVTQRQRIIGWANNLGTNLSGTKKHEVAETLENTDLHPDVRNVLEILQESGGSAPTKAQALLNRHVTGWYKDATRYFGARSGRGTSEGANMFNIARPSGKYNVEQVIQGLKAGFKYDNTALTDALRGCIVAPHGWSIIDNDLANAELRLALWQSGDRERLTLLENKSDLYMHNAITMWNLPVSATKDTHPTERYNGKTCLSKDTSVLTISGWKSIIDVTKHDLLWDGETWVPHKGVICRGRKETLDVWGVRATLDHMIFTSMSGRKIPFGAMAQSMIGRKQALFLGASSFLAACNAMTDKLAAGGLWRDANAVTKRLQLSGRTSNTAELAAAILADTKRVSQKLKNIIRSLIFVPTRKFATALSTACQQFTAVAKIQSQNTTPVTAGAAFAFGPHGVKTERRSWPTFSRFRVTMIKTSTLIAKTMNADTNPETCVSSRQKSTVVTSEPSHNSKRSELVYDILDSGPKHRFLIASPQGHYLLVANCTLGGNYQLGWKTYKAHMRKIGTPVSETKAQDDIKNYRKANPLLVQLWENLKKAWTDCFYEPPGRYFFAGKIALIKDGTTIWMTLPSGRSIPHYSCFVGQDGNMGFFRAKFGAMLPQKVFGGSLLEISCQSMCRDVITACEEDIEKEMPDTVLLLDVYDSIIALAPVEVAEQRAEQMRSIMRRQRYWTKGMPLDAEGYAAPRMKK